MPTYRVEMSIKDHLVLEVEAEDSDEAYDIAHSVDVSDWTLRESETTHFEIHLESE